MNNMNPEKNRNREEIKRTENRDKSANNNTRHIITKYAVAIGATIALFMLIVFVIKCSHIQIDQSCPIKIGPEQKFLLSLTKIVIVIAIIMIYPKRKSLKQKSEKDELKNMKPEEKGNTIENTIKKIIKYRTVIGSAIMMFIIIFVGLICNTPKHSCPIDMSFEEWLIVITLLIITIIIMIKYRK